MMDKAMSNPISILILGIETIKGKNLNQLIGLSRYGYQFVILTNDSFRDSREIIGDANNVDIHICNPKWIRLSLIVSLIRILFTRRIDLVEIYPNSYLTLMMTAFVKLAKIPVIIIARGEEYKYVTNQMSKMRRLAFRWTYSLSDHVIYRELYMKEMLVDMGKNSVWMLHNAVAIPNHVNEQRSRKCYFLFINSMKLFRHPEVALKAFLKLCEEFNLTSQSQVRLIIVGLLVASDTANKEAELQAMLAGRDVPVELHPWTNKPGKWLDNADVFLLPADVVFLNNSLLEAMSRGVPPIVQEAEGSELIITHGVDGYILPLDEVAWQKHMRSLILDVPLRIRLGHAARQKVAEQYSLDAYLERYDDIYRTIISKRSDRFNGQ